jgi:ADP-ribose pyrophosphatase YjhB (NUDIX family)
MGPAVTTLVALVAAVAALAASGCGGGDNGNGGGNGDRTATTRLPAATLTLLRDTERGLEVLLVRRNSEATFGADTGWGFPSGPVNSGVVGGEAARRAATARLAELTKIGVNADELVAYSRWITPRVTLFPSGVDTRFYLALAPVHSRPHPDGSQIVDAGWFELQQALDRHHAGLLQLDYPTTKHLKSLVGFANAADAIETARRRELKPVELRIVRKGDQQRVVLPDQ